MNRTQLVKVIVFAALMVGTAKSSAVAASATAIPDFRLATKTFFRADTHFKHDRKVFAWYMVCCGPFGGMEQSREGLIAQYKAEIQMAQSMGIDGFGLDIMRPNDTYHKAVDAMFEAARQLDTNFELFFECDYGEPTKSPSDYAELVKRYADHPNCLKVNGHPLVCAYGADMEAYGADPSAAIAWWRSNLIDPLKAAACGVTFVPTTWKQLRLSGGSVQTSDAEMAAWGNVSQGMSMWEIQLSPIGGGLDVLNRQAIEAHKANKAWMATIATHYWGGANRSVPGWYWKPGDPLSPRKQNAPYWEHAGGEGLAAQWDAAMNAQRADWVMMLTWNDFNESYIEPIDDYRKYVNGSGGPIGWYKPQAGLDELNRYYIQWYKTGEKPTITNDSIFYSYRTHSSKLVAAKDDRPPVISRLGPIEDTLYITTALTAPAQFHIASGSSVAHFDLPSGITQTKTPFQAGRQIFSLWRNGKQIATVTGEPIVDKIDFYDYWTTTGFVEAQSGHR